MIRDGLKASDMKTLTMLNGRRIIKIEPPLATVKRRTLAWFWHVTCHDSLSRVILQGIVEGGQCPSCQRKCWMDNIKEWTSRSHARAALNGPLQKRLEEDLY